MAQAGNTSLLSLQANIICVLLAVIAVDIIVQHHDWLDGVPVQPQAQIAR